MQELGNEAILTIARFLKLTFKNNYNYNYTYIITQWDT